VQCEAPHFATPSDFTSATIAIISASVLSAGWEPPTTIETFFAKAVFESCRSSSFYRLPR
jgi:hypothetical protein